MTAPHSPAREEAVLKVGWLKRDTAKAAARVAEWSSNQEPAMGVHEYVEGYEFRGDQDYTPNDHEKTLIEDAILGYLGLIAALAQPASEPSGCPDDAIPEMVAAALKVDWSNEDEEGVAHNVWHAMRAAMPKRSEPAGGGVREAVKEHGMKALPEDVRLRMEREARNLSNLWANGDEPVRHAALALQVRTHVAALSSPASSSPAEAEALAAGVDWKGLFEIAHGALIIIAEAQGDAVYAGKIANDLTEAALSAPAQEGRS